MVNSGISRSLQEKKTGLRKTERGGFFFFKRKDRAKRSWGGERKKTGTLCLKFFFPGFHFQTRHLLSWCMLIFSFLAILSHAIIYIIWAVEWDQWSVADAERAVDKVDGFSNTFFFLFLLVDNVLESKLKGQLQLDMDKGACPP